METVKIVIGANFGDEGKGLMTDYYANEAKEQNKSCLVVCHNGGSQKGHTVVSPSGLRHVFHHFGSGCFAGADTYLAESFIVNPIIFNKEFSELHRKELVTKCFVHPDCLVTTPFDMMINQIVEEYRGGNKHGSCGLGVFETIVRNERVIMPTTFYDCVYMKDVDILLWLSDVVSSYLPARLKELGVETLPLKWVEILNNKDNIIRNFINDIREMYKHVIFTDNSCMEAYDYVIFEGGQGLLLDCNNAEYMPHLTPSNTGIENPLDIIASRYDLNDLDIEVCYVSRTYMTRHGAGRFDSECNKSDINPTMVDITNVPNPYQDSLRYGILDIAELKARVLKDCKDADVKKSIVFTHFNEYELDCLSLRKTFDDFNIYISDGMTRDSVSYYS